MTQSADYRTCRTCGRVIQKRTALIHKFPQLFELPEPQPDPYRWATADAAELTACGTGEPDAAHLPAAPADCVTGDDGGQCVNYAAEYPGGPNLHACRDLAAAARPGPGAPADPPQAAAVGKRAGRQPAVWPVRTKLLPRPRRTRPGPRLRHLGPLSVARMTALGDMSDRKWP